MKKMVVVINGRLYEKLREKHMFSEKTVPRMGQVPESSLAVFRYMFAQKV